MKDKIKAFFNSLKAFIREHSTVLFIAALLLVAIVLTLVYKGLPDDVSSQDDGNTISIVSTEDTTSDENSVSSDIEQTKPDNEQTDTTVDEQTTSNQPVNSKPSKPSNKKPSTSSPGTSSTNKNENTISKPSSNPSINTGSVTVPSSAALKESGLTIEESQAIVEAAKTCRHCGQLTGGSHHRYGIDVTCPDCGVLAKANTCHFCK